jgi:hypothetical protein
MKAFASCEPLLLRDIRKTIGQQALNALFDEAFVSHPDDAVTGAEFVRTNLYGRYGNKLLEMGSIDPTDGRS